MIWYAQRNEDGKIIGLYANKQTYATEELSDADQEVINHISTNDIRLPVESEFDKLKAEIDTLKSQMTSLEAK